MNKKDFIQRYVIRVAPQARIDTMRAIDHAGMLWDWLSEVGQGEAKKTGQRESKDYYVGLHTKEKKWFDLFWNAFNCKNGKQNAVKAWLKLDPSEEMAARIVKAAKAEAAKPRQPGEIRQYPEGWLSQRKFDDYSEADIEKPKRNQEKLSLQSELKAYESMLILDEHATRRIHEINERLAELT